MLHNERLNEGTSERDKLELSLLGTLRRPARADVTGRTKKVRMVFGVLGLAGAAVAAVYAYDRWDSVWPSVFVGLLVLQLISRAAADVITDSRKIRRALYFLFQAAVVSAVFYGVYQAWGMWWLAFLIAVLGGGFAFQILAPLLFPAIHREETADTLRRWHQAV